MVYLNALKSIRKRHNTIKMFVPLKTYIGNNVCTFENVITFYCVPSVSCSQNTITFIEFGIWYSHIIERIDNIVGLL